MGRQLSLRRTRRPYTQNYFEVGWTQEAHPNVSVELNTYLHAGHNSFENHEISISRIFVPINFHTARSEGAELVFNFGNRTASESADVSNMRCRKPIFTGPSQVASPETNCYRPASELFQRFTRHTQVQRRCFITVAGTIFG